MYQVIDPKYEVSKDLENLKITIRCYDHSATVHMNDKRGFMVFHKSYESYDESVIDEIKNFIQNYDDEQKGKAVSLSEKMYFYLSNKLI